MRDVASKGSVSSPRSARFRTRLASSRCDGASEVTASEVLRWDQEGSRVGESARRECGRKHRLCVEVSWRERLDGALHEGVISS